MSDNLKLYEQVRGVPDEAKKTIKGGRLNGYTDINPMWRIKKLTELYGPCGIGWYYKPTKEWLEHAECQIAAFVEIELYIKADSEWSKPISGTGGSMFVAKERSGPYVSDECYKMATTDAISVACKQLGIGADVYWDGDNTKYSPSQKQIGKEMADTLRLLFTYSGVDEQKVLKSFKVSKLEELTLKQQDNLNAGYEKVIGMCGIKSQGDTE